MAKSRKKIFPKKPERLNSKTAELLGKNSNQGCYIASYYGIYKNDAPIVTKAPLTERQLRQLEVLKRNLCINL